MVDESLVPGEFVPCTITYTVHANSSNIGKPILIDFDAGAGQFYVDNVSVDFTPANPLTVSLPVVNPGFDNLYTDPTMSTPFTLNGSTYGLGGPGNYSYCTQNGVSNHSCYVPGWASASGAWNYNGVIYSSVSGFPLGGYSGNVMWIQYADWVKESLASNVQAGPMF